MTPDVRHVIFVLRTVRVHLYSFDLRWQRAVATGVSKFIDGVVLGELLLVDCSSSGSSDRSGTSGVGVGRSRRLLVLPSGVWH